MSCVWQQFSFDLLGKLHLAGTVFLLVPLFVRIISISVHFTLDPPIIVLSSCSCSALVIKTNNDTTYMMTIV